MAICLRRKWMRIFIECYREIYEKEENQNQWNYKKIDADNLHKLNNTQEHIHTWINAWIFVYE